MGDYGGNCGNVNVKGTNGCCAASTKDINDETEFILCVLGASDTTCICTIVETIFFLAVSL